MSTIAYDGIFNEQQVIFSDLPENFETLGLMQCASELYVDEGAAVSYNFLHLTIQEYLAAFHLSQQPVEKQIKHFQTKHNNKGERDHFQIVLRFLAGLKRFKEYPSKVMNSICIEIKKRDSKSGVKPNSILCRTTLNVLHWLFEVQDIAVISKLLGSSLVHISKNNTGIGILKPFDCFVLGFCVSHSNCTWSISFPSCFIEDEGVELLVRGAVEKETQCTGGITEIEFPSNNITNKSVSYLPKLPQQMVNTLEALSLCDNKLDSDSCAIFTRLVPHMPNLQKLDLSRNPIMQGGAAPLITSLIGHNSLEELTLPSISIGSEGCQALGKMLSTSTTIKKLTIDSFTVPLDSQYNDDDDDDETVLPKENTELIINGLRNNKTLKELSIKCSRFSQQSSIVLGSTLTTNHSLVCLYLPNSNVNLYHLANALCTNNTLQKLHLALNRIRTEVAVKLALALKSNHTLLELGLGNCNIDMYGACHLATAFHTNHTLQELCLCSNSIGDEGAALFAEMLRRNRSLKKLYLSDASIHEKGIQKLIDSLIDNKTLEKLGLPYEYRQEYVTDRRVCYVYSYFDTHEGQQIFPAIRDSWCIILFITFVNLVISLLTAYIDYNLLYTIVGVVIVNILIILFL